MEVRQGDSASFKPVSDLVNRPDLVDLVVQTAEGIPSSPSPTNSNIGTIVEVPKDPVATANLDISSISDIAATADVTTVTEVLTEAGVV